MFRGFDDGKSSGAGGKKFVFERKDKKDGLARQEPREDR